MPADSQRIFPVDEFVKEELYPGYRQAFGSQPFVAGPGRPVSLADNERYWLRDSLHFSEGMVPASIATLDDAQTWGAQLGAEIVGVPPTRGSVNRLAGTHVYIGTIDVDTPWQVQARAARFGQYVSPILADFDSYWAMRAGELTSAYEHFDNLDLPAMSGQARAVDGAEGRVRLPPAGLVHSLRGHVRADRELPGVLRARRGDRAVGVAGVGVPRRGADVLQQDRRGALAAGGTRALPRPDRAAHARRARGHARADRGPAAAVRPGSRSSTRSLASTGSAARRPAASTRRRGSRTRPRRSTRSAGSSPSRPGSTSTRRARPRSPSATRRSTRHGGTVKTAVTCSQVQRGARVEPRPRTSPGGTRSTTT